MATAPEVLHMLANSSIKLSDALRQAMLLPEVRDDPEFLAWIEHELAGYPSGDDIPEYRCRAFVAVGDANNGAWLHKGVTIPIHSFSQTLQDYESKPNLLLQSVGTFEALLASDSNSFQIPWDEQAVAILNYEIRQGGTAVNRTYHFDRVGSEVPRPVVEEILEIVRHRALAELSKRVPPDQLATRIVEELPTTRAPVAVQGSGNQVIVSSPGASATLTVDAGDWPRLSEALASLGIDGELIDELRDVLEDGNVDEPGKVMRALAWSRRAAAELGVSTAGSAAATLILQYLGQLT